MTDYLLKGGRMRRLPARDEEGGQGGGRPKIYGSSTIAASPARSVVVLVVVGMGGREGGRIEIGSHEQQRQRVTS